MVIPFRRLHARPGPSRSRGESDAARAPKKQQEEGLSVESIGTNAAGIDVGATEVYVAIPPDLAGHYKPANRFQTQLLCFVHADVQSSSCLTLQAHLVLEESSLSKKTGV